MTQASANSSASTGKGKAFFDRADQVAATGNWDFAIEMYLEGIVREPDNMPRGHQALRDVSLKRKAQAGKGPSMMERLKCSAAKDNIQALRNAEFLLAKEPGSVPFMEAVLKASLKCQLPVLTKWICDILMESERQAEKRDKRVLILLTKAYDDLKEYRSAVQACQWARELAPTDQALADILRILEANETIKAGGFGERDHDFTDAVKDIKTQQDLAQKDRFVQSKSFQEQQIERARVEYEKTPTIAGKILALVDALLKVEQDGYENEAIDVLAKAHKDTGSYQFKMKTGDIRIRQMKRRYQALMAKGDKAAAAEQAQQQLEFELAEYADRAANYPTDMGIKFEWGRRLLVSGKFDEAIAAFQQAQRDPRRHVQAMVMLGQAFARKGWLREAGETLEKTLQDDMTEERRKDVLYQLGDVKEKLGDANESKEDLAKAQDYFSQLAQLDFNYKDVRDRLDALRKRLQ